MSENHHRALLRQRQADLNTALVAAVKQQNITEVQVLLAQGAEVNARDNVDHNPLQQSPSPQISYVGPTGLMIAADEGIFSLSQTLLNKGADINASGVAVGEMSATTCPTSVADLTPTAFPLMEAVWGGNPAVVQLLLTRGANVNMRDVLGHTALMYAPQAGLDSARRTGSDISIYGPWQQESDQIALMLLTKGADINAADNEGKTVLMRTVALRGIGPIQVLMNHGANINARDKSGDSVLSFALRLDVYKFLVARGAKK